MPRALFIGNCHAQYFASALQELTGLEVKFIGGRHGGVSFWNAIAPSVSPAEGYEWVSSGSERGVILVQTTPGRQVARFEAIARNTGALLVKFAFPKFEAFFVVPEPERGLAFGSDAFEERLAIVRRTDRIFNEIGFAKAGWDVEELDRLEALVRTRPILLANSHFSGEGMAFIARLINRGGLRAAIGVEAARAFEEGVTDDLGIANGCMDLPEPFSRSHGLIWWPSLTFPDLVRRLHAEPAAFALDLRAGLARTVSEPDAHRVWRTALRRYTKHGRLADFRVAMALYRTRRHVSWAAKMVRALNARERYLASSLLIRHRLTLSDSRETFLPAARNVLAVRNIPALAAAVAA